MTRQVLVFGALAATALLAADFAGEGKRWWAHIQVLADDRLEGRGTGTVGFQEAAEYVAREFHRYGLKPAGTSGYLQAVRFETRRVVEEGSSLVLVRGGEAAALTLGKDASINARSEAQAVEAPMVFVGHGMAIPEAHYDELAGLDLKGKIAVYVAGSAPVEASANLKAHYASSVERWAAIERAGAIGVAAIDDPRNDTSAGRGAGRPPMALLLAERGLRESAGQAIALTIERQGAEKFFAGSGHTFAEIERLALANAALPRFPLAATLRAKIAVTQGRLQAPNVVGLLRGSDRRLRDEYVVLSAHLDHMGNGRPVNGDAIYNGAMDNASGIASILEIARLMKEGKVRPKRSVLFLAVAAEEQGELGSRYFAVHPTVVARRIVADINLDMFLPLYALKAIEVQGLTESTLGDQVRAAAAAAGVAVQTDREPEQNRFIRSDQYSFVRQGVPALAFKFGYEYGSPEEKIRQDWVRDRYHQPSDDLGQPVNCAAAAQFDRVILGLLERVANDAARPAWRAESFFKRFASAD